MQAADWRRSAAYQLFSLLGISFSNSFSAVISSQQQLFSSLQQLINCSASACHL
jgi:hypothetical protein